MQSSSSFADLLHNGVEAVLQLLQMGAFPSEGELLIGAVARRCGIEGEIGEELVVVSHGGGGETALEGGNDLEC